MPVKNRSDAQRVGAACDRCPLNRQIFVPSKPAKTPAPPTWAVVGEAPGQQELVKHEPFVGPSGHIGDALLRGLGLTRDEVFITNAVSCYPGVGDEKTSVFAAAQACCAPRLDYELAQLPIENILALGANAASALRHTEVKILEEEGKRVHDTQGRLIHQTFHPAYCLRFPGAFTAVGRSIERWRNPPRKAPSPRSVEYTLIDTEKKLAQLVELVEHKLIAVDLETTSLNTQEAIILCAAVYSGETPYIITQEVIYNWPALFLDMLRRSYPINHNFKFDWQVIYTQLGDCPDFVYDTMLADYALNEQVWGHGLKDIVEREWELAEPYDAEIEAERKKHKKTAGWHYGWIEADKLYRYAALDAYFTWHLYFIQQPQLEAEGLVKLVAEHLVPLQNTWAKLELNGFVVDVELQERLKIVYASKAKEIQAGIRKAIKDETFNPGSWQQVYKLLYEVLQLAPPDVKVHTKTAGTKTGKAVLEVLKEQHRLPGDVLEWRKVRKTEGYLKMTLDPDGKIRPDVYLAGTVTGRLSTQRLVNIPREGEIKKLFTAGEGYLLIQADYKQAELVTLANISRDAFLVEMFVRGYDIHTAVQEAVSKVTLISRTTAKNVNFGIVYSGGDAKAIAYTTGLPLQTVEEIVAAYFKQAPGVKAYLEDIYTRVKRDGYIQTIFGRRRRFPLITPDTWHSIKNEAANFECQSVASDFTQRAVLKLAQSKLCQVILSVHDSIIVRCREEDVTEAKKELEAVMVEIPTQYYKLAPYRVDIAVGYTWGDMK